MSRKERRAALQKALQEGAAAAVRRRPQPVLEDCEECNGQGQMQKHCTNCGQGITEANVVRHPEDYDVDVLDLCKQCYDEERGMADRKKIIYYVRTKVNDNYRYAVKYYGDVSYTDKRGDATPFAEESAAFSLQGKLQSRYPLYKWKIVPVTVRYVQPVRGTEEDAF